MAKKLGKNEEIDIDLHKKADELEKKIINAQNSKNNKIIEENKEKLEAALDIVVKKGKETVENIEKTFEEESKKIEKEVKKFECKIIKFLKKIFKK